MDQQANNKLQENEEFDTAEVAAVRTSDQEREAQLLDTLGTSGLRLPAGERDFLQSLLVEFADLFALDNTELGRTSVVAHQINTGDSRPIKQYPRHVPFSLRGKVPQLVQEMLQQGVIKQSSSPCCACR